jgi:hypothetical protein
MQPDPLNPAPIRPLPAWATRVMGIVAGDAVVFLIYVAGVTVLPRLESLAVLGIPSFFLVPVVGGLVASYVWRGLNPTIGATVVDTLWMTFVAAAVAMLAFHEGMICILIVSPLLFISALAGSLTGRIFFKRPPSRLQITVLPLVFVAALAEPVTRVQTQKVVTDQITIRAPAQKIWPQLKVFPEIPSAPHFWLFRLGLPYPVSTTSSGDFVGANRECIFSGDAIFKERVVEFVPLEKLTFDILESPKDPELIGHLTPRRGQFLLHDNGDGTTTLTGSTWYTLQVRPAWYFEMWTRHIFGAVHARVMEDIRRRAENAD